MHNCDLCRKPKASWLAKASNGRSWLVHRSCGRTLEAEAPEGVTVKVVPGEELKRQWAAKGREKRRQNRARQLWHSPLEGNAGLARLKSELSEQHSEGRGP